MKRHDVFAAGAGFPAAIEFLRRELRKGDGVSIKGRAIQRLERIRLALEGRRVASTIGSCPTRAAHCPICPMLERGWGRLRLIA